MEKHFDIDPRRLEELRRRALALKARDDLEAGEFQRKAKPASEARHVVVTTVLPRAKHPSRPGAVRLVAATRGPVRHERGFEEV